MLQINTYELCQLLGADCTNIDNIHCNGVGTDTRENLEGQLFVALSGENFNGADFVDNAQRAGAVAAITNKPVDSDIPILVVDDTLAALTQLAQHHLSTIKPMVIGITGSNGKTTVKNLLFNILNLQAPTLATRGNLNNHIGVPLTLLELTEHHQYAIIEMGANHLGEIAHLREIAQPDIALVTNTGDAHIGEFGGFENLVKAKGEIYSGHSQNIVNTNTSFAGDLSFGEDGDVFASEIDNNQFRLNLNNESIQVGLQLIGRHNIGNALAASACAHALGLSLEQIKQGLEVTPAEPGRLALIQIGAMRIIDDSYNANPESIKAAIKTLGEFTGEKVIVLGRMAELGADSTQLHAEIGEIAKQHSDVFYSFDENTEPYQTQHFDSAQTLATHLSTHHTQATVLFKGSRIAKLEQIIAKIAV